MEDDLEWEMAVIDSSLYWLSDELVVDRFPRGSVVILRSWEVAVSPPEEGPWVVKGSMAIP